MYNIGGQAVCLSNSCMPEMCSNTQTNMCSSTLLTLMISNLLLRAAPVIEVTPAAPSAG